MLQFYILLPIILCSLIETEKIVHHNKSNTEYIYITNLTENDSLSFREDRFVRNFKLKHLLKFLYIHYAICVNDKRNSEDVFRKCFASHFAFFFVEAISDCLTSCSDDENIFWNINIKQFIENVSKKIKSIICENPISFFLNNKNTNYTYKMTYMDFLDNIKEHWTKYDEIFSKMIKSILKDLSETTNAGLGELLNFFDYVVLKEGSEIAKFDKPSNSEFFSNFEKSKEKIFFNFLSEKVDKCAENSVIIINFDVESMCLSTDILTKIVDKVVKLKVSNFSINKKKPTNLIIIKIS
ncbi:hypothetical protein EDEG_03077 [Edhazardia aedis USNM 41457]|uniref:Uncharacterized protein n=1 Tax=Edhazardia aedis (strain USNM 41457) TaxID=1003232 RepID=J9D3X0_EDHAE|nr:hypothetical protein EDEG_03077 [Edhazardia aedis USNM 41457]|eukprot:EJW02511.1 hypothetical protein EDEG_03077 [Edhazardia aedis USNM 41457]